MHVCAVRFVKALSGISQSALMFTGLGFVGVLADLRMGASNALDLSLDCLITSTLVMVDSCLMLKAVFCTPPSSSFPKGGAVS